MVILGKLIDSSVIILYWELTSGPENLFWIGPGSDLTT